jgi:hypothetical protein
MGAGVAQVTPLSPQDYGSPEHHGPHDAWPSADPMRPDRADSPANGVLQGAEPAPVLPGEDVLPVHPALHGLLPAGGLQRGSVVTTGCWSLLCLVLAAQASADGAWCAVAGVPEFGARSAVDAGLDPDRLLLVADPGDGWPQVTASLLDGFEIVLLRPPQRPSAQLRRRVEAAVRRYAGVLLVAEEWEGAATRLRIAQQEWTGIGAGHGRLRARRVQVVADGRGAWSRPRARWLWLPGPDGSVAAAADQAGDDVDAASFGMEPVCWQGLSTG